MPHPASFFLMYHELALPNRRLCQSQPGYVRYVISIEEFRAQMSAIHDSGLRASNVSDALTFSEPGVAITVDDGCETDLVAIAPILQQLGFGATFYVTAGFLGKPGYMAPSQLQELSRLGFEVGCHSMTHAYLSDLDDASLQREIVESKRVLEEIIARPIEHFSCPGGRHDSRTIQVARSAGYRTLATSSPRPNSPSSDLFSLGRVAITRGLNNAAFEKLCRGKTLWRLGLGVGLRDGAKRLLGNAAYDRMRAIILGR